MQTRVLGLKIETRPSVEFYYYFLHTQKTREKQPVTIAAAMLEELNLKGMGSRLSGVPVRQIFINLIFGHSHRFITSTRC